MKTAQAARPATLSEMLTERRIELGVSREVAAVQIGTNRTTFTAWESGADAPQQLKWVRPLASWLDVPSYRVAASLGIIEDGEFRVLVDALGGYIADLAA